MSVTDSMYSNRRYNKHCSTWHVHVCTYNLIYRLYMYTTRKLTRRAVKYLAQKDNAYFLHFSDNRLSSYVVNGVLHLGRCVYVTPPVQLFTLIRCLFIHLVNVFFCTVSRSSETDTWRKLKMFVNLLTWQWHWWRHSVWRQKSGSNTCAWFVYKHVKYM